MNSQLSEAAPLQFEITKRTDERLLRSMAVHYSQPKGFVGRNICYAIVWGGIYYGHIVAGSATLHLPGRHEYLGTARSDLNNIVNNIFYHIEKVSGAYPCRNFTSHVIQKWQQLVEHDWPGKYGNPVLGFETLIELPRTGECYRRAGWQEVGQTVGYTCKRGPGQGTDGWTGARVWDTKNLRPKRVFCHRTIANCFAATA